MATTKRGQKPWHPFSNILDPAIKLAEGEDVASCFTFVEEVCVLPCRNRITGNKMKRVCNCLSILVDNADRQQAVANYMALFIRKPVQERHSIIMEWMRYTSHADINARCYFLPFVVSDDGDNPFLGDDEEIDEGNGEDEFEPAVGELNNNGVLELKPWMVCRYAISLLLDYGRIKWQRCQTAVSKNLLFEHGSKGKVPGTAKRFSREVKEDLHKFFHQMKQFGQTKSTRFVREETGTGLRDGENIDLLELPSCWSKRSVYSRFCLERGYVVTSSHSGIIKRKKRGEDDDWNVAHTKTVCGWSTFLRFWDQNYPLIRLASPAADICTDCHIFFNRTKYVVAAEDDTVVDDAPVNATSQTSTNYTAPTHTTTTLEMETSNDDDEETHPLDLVQLEPTAEILEREASLLKATLHVRQALIQRQLANAKIQQAIDTANLPHSERSYCFIADYSQNVELPFFGSSQPGDSYYFSPLKINVFGVVDCSIFGGKLSAHVYHEGVAKKGGNNVTSLIIKELSRLNLLVDGDPPGKELTFIMDNCAGQNKNRMVLRLATWLVEAEYFEKVNFIFYIVGHTKNACDRWFSILKQKYRRRNIYSFDDLDGSLKTHSYITVTAATEDDFFDYDKFWDTIYKRLQDGTTHKTHIFSAEKNNKTTLVFRNDDLPDTLSTTQDLMKKGTNTPTRAALVKSPPFIKLKPPGIPPIKQVELFSKYRLLIPESYRDLTCPDPGEDVKVKIKSERNTKQRERTKKARQMKQEEQEQDEENKKIEPLTNDDRANI